MVTCPYCGATGDRVLYEGVKRRRYKCLECHRSFRAGKVKQRVNKEDAKVVASLMQSIVRYSRMKDIGMGFDSIPDIEHEEK